MKRELLLLDVTEMSGSNVCIAGIDLNSGEQIRLADPTPTRAHVRKFSLAPGDVIEVDATLKRRATRPHVEDAEWRFIRKICRLDHADLLERLRQHAFDSVRSAFGDPAVRARNCAWPPGAGDRSLRPSAFDTRVLSSIHTESRASRSRTGARTTTRPSRSRTFG